MDVKTINVAVDKSSYERKDALRVKWADVIEAGLDKLEELEEYRKK